MYECACVLVYKDTALTVMILGWTVMGIKLSFPQQACVFCPRDRKAAMQTVSQQGSLSQRFCSKSYCLPNQPLHVTQYSIQRSESTTEIIGCSTCEPVLKNNLEKIWWDGLLRSSTDNTNVGMLHLGYLLLLI